MAALPRESREPRRRLGVVVIGSAILVVAAALLAHLFGEDTRPPVAPVTPPAEPARLPESPAPERRRIPAPETAAAAEPAPKPTPPPAPVSHDITGRVVDENGAPVARATIALYAADESEVARTTSGDDGTFRCPDGVDAAPVLLVARAPPHATTAVELHVVPGQSPEPLDIVLAAGAVIEGEVRLVSGGAPRVPVRVLARCWDLKGMLGGWSDGVEEAAVRGDARLATVLADTDGRFRIEGLPPGAEYGIWAGGEGLGLATVEMVSVVRARAGGPPVTIWLAPLYVLDVRVVGADGQKLALRPGVTDGGISPCSFSGPFMNNHPSAGFWSGVDRRTDDGPPYHQKMLLTASFEAERIGPYRFRASAPGHQAVTEEVWALRATPGLDATHEIRLERIVEDLGALRIRFDDRGTGFAALFVDYPENGGPLVDAPRIALYPVGERRPGVSAVHIDGRAFADEETSVDIDGIPTGAYSARLLLPFASEESRAWHADIVIAADAATELLVPVPEWSALELRPALAGDESAPYSGPLEVRVHRSGRSGFKPWRFTGPPYRVVGLGPADYDIVLRARKLDAKTLTVSLRPDEMNVVPCELARVSDD